LHAFCKFKHHIRGKREPGRPHFTHNRGRKEGSLRAEEKLRGKSRVSLEEAEEEEEAKTAPFLSLTAEKN
jgi:hypothetical protein